MNLRQFSQTVWAVVITFMTPARTTQVAEMRGDCNGPSCGCEREPGCYKHPSKQKPPASLSHRCGQGVSTVMDLVDGHTDGKMMANGGWRATSPQTFISQR